MSMTVQVSSRSQSVLFANQFTPRYSPPPNGDWRGTVATYDALLYIADGRNWSFRGGVCTIGQMYGLKGYYGQGETFTVSFPPIKPIFPYLYDLRHYGNNILANLQLFGSTISGRSFIAPSSEKQNPVRHRNFLGTITSKQSEVSWIDRSYVIGGVSIPVRYTGHELYAKVEVQSLNPLVTRSVMEWVGTEVNNDFEYLLRFLQANGFSRDFKSPSGLSNLHSVLSSLDFFVGDSGALHVNYHMAVSNLTYGGTVEWDSEFIFPVEFPSPLVDPVIGGVVPNRPTVPYSFSYRNFVDSTGAYYPPTSDTWSPSNTSWYCSLVQWSIPEAVDMLEVRRIDSAVSRLYRGYALNSFKQAIDDSWDDIVPSSAFSTVDAFKQMTGSLDNNVLQTIAKIPEISSALPDIRAAISILGDLVSRDLSVATIRDILDLASSTVLQGNFQWRPYYELLTKYLPQILSTLSSMSELRHLEVGYGSYTFELFNKLGRQEVTLHTRSKIVMDASTSGLASAALAIDSFGLLPKVSRAWDLVPFTFVVNWFTGIGKAIERAEYSLLLATIPAFYIHSYSLTSPLTEDELESLKVTSVGSEPASLKVYYRDISVYTPFPRDSRFGFGLPQGYPNSGILGSLLYQLFFS